MSYCQEQVIVLNKTTVNNGDRWYSLVGEESGCFNVLVKAAARTNSKLAGHLEIGRRAKVLIVQGSKIKRLAGAQLASAYQEMICSWQQLYWRRKGLYLIDRITLTKEEGMAIFTILDSYLTVLSEQTDSRKLTVYYALFQAHLLTSLGWSAGSQELSEVNYLLWSELSDQQQKNIIKLINLFFHRQLSWSEKMEWLSKIDLLNPSFATLVKMVDNYYSYQLN